jgi:hypothetical protein
MRMLPYAGARFVLAAVAAVAIATVGAGTVRSHDDSAAAQLTKSGGQTLVVNTGSDSADDWPWG